MIEIRARRSVIGVIVGLLPGAGGNIAAFLSYNEAKRASKTPDEFGEGSPEGPSGEGTLGLAGRTLSLSHVMCLAPPTPRNTPTQKCPQRKYSKIIPPLYENISKQEQTLPGRFPTDPKTIQKIPLHRPQHIVHIV